MINMNLKRVKMDADRDAIMYIAKPRWVKTLFHDLRLGLGSFSKSTTVTENLTVSSPLEVYEEINNNSLLLETLIFEFAELVQLNPYDLVAHRYLIMAQNSEHRAAVQAYHDASDGDVERSAEIENFSRFIEWLECDRLPKGFRRTFVDSIIQVGDLHDTIANLSQYRWERLRNWIHAYV